MLIILVSFTMLAAIISTMMVNFYTDSSREQLSSAAEAVRYLIKDRVSDAGEEALKSYVRDNTGEVKTYLSAITRYNRDVSILITDKSGRILVSMGFHDRGPSADDAIPGEILTTLFREERYAGNSDLGGLFATRYKVYAIPFEDASGFGCGAVFVCSTAESLAGLMKTTVRAIVMTCLWVLMAALIAVYFITDRIIGPLKDMGRAAKSFAAGKFDVRVPVTGRDEIAELAVAFNNMAGSLADLENMRSTFLSNVSHDLRTPMTTISGFIDGLLDGTIPEEKRDYYLRVIGDEVRRLSRLVAALLDISRIQAGDRKFTMTAFDICEMARVILISFEQKIDKKKLEVSFEAEPENLYVWADRDAIYQILYNICDNGVKFSREGGHYRVKITERDKKVFVSVYNEGDGIREEELPHVFERFYKTDKSRSLDKTGVGLGLYIAKSIIDAHNEEIWVKSKYGEYCEFVFTLKKATESQIKKIFDRKSGDETKRLDR